VTIYLVRHAKAGVRSKWDGPDELRPLSDRGHRQATALGRVIRDDAGDRALGPVLSSPYLRCVQTVEPLARDIGEPVERLPALAEGTALAPALRILEKHVDRGAVVCLHGDLLPAILLTLQDRKLKLPHDRVEKGSVWALDVTRGEVRRIRYFPPPR
jgi:phosphohistidine phosphatase SixA